MKAAFAQVSQDMVIFFAFITLLSFFLLAFVSWFIHWMMNRPASMSPYSEFPLRPAKDLSYYYKVKLYEYLEQIEDYENRKFPIYRSSFCRESRRVFPNSITWYGAIRVDWDFLAKRCPGSYVSWGSLTEQQKAAILEEHGSLKGFQTEISSPEPAPRAIAPEYAFAHPGPLYVDLDTKLVLGWKIVPGTDIETLVVQKPLKKRASLEPMKRKRPKSIEA